MCADRDSKRPTLYTIVHTKWRKCSSACHDLFQSCVSDEAGATREFIAPRPTCGVVDLRALLIPVDVVMGEALAVGVGVCVRGVLRVEEEAEMVQTTEASAMSVARPRWC
eukprot:5749254-Pleurochrysis_carterae.AAC.3